MDGRTHGSFLRAAWSHLKITEFSPDMQCAASCECHFCDIHDIQKEFQLFYPCVFGSLQ